MLKPKKVSSLGFNRQDHACLPRLSLLPTAGQLGHDDLGQFEEFVWSFDFARHLGGKICWGQLKPKKAGR